jgi:hypothetical protein
MHVNIGTRHMKAQHKKTNWIMQPKSHVKWYTNLFLIRYGNE